MTNTRSPYAVKPRDNAFIHQFLGTLHYADCYAARLSQATDVSIDRLAYNIFAAGPQLVQSFMQVRDVLVRPFGIEAGARSRPEAAKERYLPGEKIGSFAVQSRDATSIILGKRDKHLDFCVLLIVTEDVFELGTYVTMHNTLGRLYFAAIKPFHKAIVKMSMAKGLGTSR